MSLGVVGVYSVSPKIRRKSAKTFASIVRERETKKHYKTLKKQTQTSFCYTLKNNSAHGKDDKG